MLLRGLSSNYPRPCVASIGNFDGVHRGHQAILAHLKEQAAYLDLPVAIIIFEPQPKEFFLQGKAPARLTPFRDKVSLLKEYGADIILCLRFNQTLSQLSPTIFAQRLVNEALSIEYLALGKDFRFGYQRQGDIQLLSSVLDKKQGQVTVIDEIQQDGHRVSSTAIREAIQFNDFNQASYLLGHPYTLSGKVVHGAKRGRQIGVPTANLIFNHHHLPVSGVYYCQAAIDDRLVPAVANIGTRPTVDGHNKVLEVHCLELDEDLYGKRLSVTFLKKIRDEKRFASFNDLANQIQQDIDKARQMTAIN